MRRQCIAVAVVAAVAVVVVVVVTVVEIYLIAFSFGSPTFCKPIHTHRHIHRVEIYAIFTYFIGLICLFLYLFQLKLYLPVIYVPEIVNLCLRAAKMFFTNYAKII